MVAGRKLLEALLVYCKIDVYQSLNEIKCRGHNKKALENKEEEKVDLNYMKIDFESL